MTFKNLFLGLYFLILGLQSTISFAEVVVNVIDEQGRPVQEFEWMWHTVDEGWSEWRAGENGKLVILEQFSKSKLVELLVRSDDFASTSTRINLASEESDSPTGETITMPKGREIRLRINSFEAAELPQLLLPQVFFPEFEWRMRMMWQPENHKHIDYDFNLLNVKRVGKDVFAFRLPPQPQKIKVAIHHPGWLQLADFGTFSEKDFVNDELELNVPRPASVEASLDLSAAEKGDLKFDRVRFLLSLESPDKKGSYHSIASEELPLDKAFKASDLPAGSYSLRILTIPSQSSGDSVTADIDPSRFWAAEEFKLTAGQSKRVHLEFVPFNEKVYRGEATARIKVVTPDGSPAKSRAIKVTFFDGHYGKLTVHEGSIPEDGVVVLEGVSSKPAIGSSLGPYAVEVDGESVGFFGFEGNELVQSFDFTLPPKPGDIAPDLDIIEVATGDTVRLNELKGKVVLVEFWATWCGPCQPAMDKLNEMARSNQMSWNGRVAIVPVSVDEASESIVRHVEDRGWTNLKHCWSPRDGSGRLSRAEKVFVVHGVPTAVLIDKDGRIAWRSHPADVRDGHTMAERIEKLLAGESLGSMFDSRLKMICVIGGLALLIVFGVSAIRRAMHRQATTANLATNTTT